MGCNCGKNKKVGISGTLTYTSKNRVPVKVRIRDWNTENAALIGAKTGVSYGYQKDGNTILMWQSDAEAAPQYFEILSKPEGVTTA